MSTRIVFAGNRDIAVKVLKFINSQGVKPLAIIVPEDDVSTLSQKMIKLCPHLDDDYILKGEKFKAESSKKILKKLDIDYIISVHFPYIYPPEILNIPKHGVVNLHPAGLPYNRGWHTPTWAIYDETPFGATLHFMDKNIDTGDIILQKQLDILPDDIADKLYQRVLDLELEIFKEAWPSLVNYSYTRKSQPKDIGTSHKKQDIKKIQQINLEENVKAEDLIKQLRALTTSNIKEAAYFKKGGEKYRLQISIQKESGE